MKKILFLCLVLGVALSRGFAQNDSLATRDWVRQYVADQLGKPILKPACKTGLDLLTVSPSGDFVEFTFQSVDVQSIDWTITKSGIPVAVGNTGKLTSSQVRLPQKITEGLYELQIRATNCSSDVLKGKKSFAVAKTGNLSGDKTNLNRPYALMPLKDPLLPSVAKTGNYELRYIESRPDFHLDLKLTEKDGQLYISDVGNSLESVSYTLNGWTDLENCGKLENEPIRPYRQYQVLKYSVARATIKESWMAEWGNPKADFRRSELFFYVVPKSETWNPAGESANPIGRPAAFSRLPSFTLTNRTYGFEYDLLDETDQRKKELSISFNWQTKHQKLYSDVLTSYLLSLPTRKAFHDLTEQECIDFANRLEVQKIMAFDIEPSEGFQWTINYDHPNFGQNMSNVIKRLEERGAKAYNWLEIPGKSVKDLILDHVTLGPHEGYGNNNQDVGKYKEAYSRLADLQHRENPSSVISMGVGYTGYDQNFSATDGNGQNIAPQLTYLKALDAGELWKRAQPEKEQIYFSWAFMEFGNYRFPQNHVVDIPAYNARARRTDNKTLYPPSFWQDNLTLGLINARYLFYWSPGPVGWDPANTTTNSDNYNKGFAPWTIEQGLPPLQTKFYLGKEALAINATIQAAYTWSQIQNAMDGTRTAPKFTYKRATKDGSILTAVTVDAITDGSWYIDALQKRQPFVLFCQNAGEKVLLIQDVWSRPGRFTELEIEIDGQPYKAVTEGNRLLTIKLQPL